MKDHELQKAVYTTLSKVFVEPEEVRVEDDGQGTLVVYIDGVTLSERGDIMTVMREYRVTGTVRLRGTISVSARSEEEARRIAEYSLADEVDTVVELPDIESIEVARV